MALKIAIATLLVVALVAGILDQCGAFKLNAHQSEDPDFLIKDYFWGNKTTKGDGVSVNATNPLVTGSDKCKKVNEWRQFSGPNFKAVSMIAEFDVNTTFHDTKAVFGPFWNVGQLVAMAENQLYNVTLYANGRGDQCQLKLKMGANAFGVTLDLSDLGMTGSFYETISAMNKEIRTDLAKKIEKPLENLLSYALYFFLFDKNIDPTVLCNQIQGSTSTEYPQPPMC